MIHPPKVELLLVSLSSYPFSPLFQGGKIFQQGAMNEDVAATDAAQQSPRPLGFLSCGRCGL